VVVQPAKTAEEFAARAESLWKAGSNADAAASYESALAALGADALSDEQLRKRIDWTLALIRCRAYHAPAENSQALERLLPLARKLLDGRRAALILYALGINAFILGQPEQALAHAHACVDAAHPNHDRDLITLCANLAGRSYVIKGLFAEGIQSLNRYLSRAGNEETDERAYCEGFLCVAHAFRGEFAEALRHGETCRRIAVAVSNLSRELVSVLYLQVALTLKGEWSAVVKLGGEPLALETPGSTRPLMLDAMRRALSGFARAMLGDVDGGYQAMRQAIEDIESTQSRQALSLHFALFAELCVRKGELERARQAGERALVNVAAGERLGETIAYRALGQCAEARGDLPQAEELLQQSVALAEARGGRANAAIGRYYLARLQAKQRKTTAARAQLDAARGEFAELGMTAWLEAAGQLAV
jgi:ATP/maltotriose-dependent transcriptional regulator MalT